MEDTTICSHAHDPSLHIETLSVPKADAAATQEEREDHALGHEARKAKKPAAKPPDSRDGSDLKRRKDNMPLPAIMLAVREQPAAKVHKGMTSSPP